MKIHHIGYLVKDMAAAQAEFDKLSYRVVSEVTFDSARGIDICFLEKDGYVVELVTPKEENSVAFSLLKKYRNAPYHICYASEDFVKEIADLCQNGYTLISEPLAAPALGGKRVAFLMNYALGMIEMLEE